MSLWLSRDTGTLGHAKALQSLSGRTQLCSVALHWSWGRLAKTSTW